MNQEAPKRPIELSDLPPFKTPEFLTFTLDYFFGEAGQYQVLKGDSKLQELAEA